jgi:hypothetical protein
VNKPIVNYAHIKIIFTPRFVIKKQLYEPQLLIKALDYISSNKVEVAEYDTMLPGERRVILRTLLCK